LTKEGKQNNAGPAFCHSDGSMYRSYELDQEFHKSLKIVQIERPDLLPEGIDVVKMYGTFRSCRRGSLTRATEEGIEGPDLDLINRWRKWESNRGGSPHMSMREHYLEIKLVLKRMLSYSKAL
jgi:endo-alpha-1,4-polygalactosaminidase (GH114 family)